MWHTNAKQMMGMTCNICSNTCAGEGHAAYHDDEHAQSHLERIRGKDVDVVRLHGGLHVATHLATEIQLEQAQTHTRLEAARTYRGDAVNGDDDGKGEDKEDGDEGGDAQGVHLLEHREGEDDDDQRGDLPEGSGNTTKPW